MPYEEINKITDMPSNSIGTGAGLRDKTPMEVQLELMEESIQRLSSCIVNLERRLIPILESSEEEKMGDRVADELPPLLSAIRSKTWVIEGITDRLYDLTRRITI